MGLSQSTLQRLSCYEAASIEGDSFIQGVSERGSDDAISEQAGSCAAVAQHCCLRESDTGYGNRAVIQQQGLSDCSLWVQRFRREVPRVTPEKTRFAEIYKIGRQLGDGSFGNVHEALPKCAKAVSSTSSRALAVKVFSIDGEASDQKFRSFVLETHMLSRIEHPNIVPMYECFQEESALFIVMELCAGGELYHRIVKQSREDSGPRLPEEEVRVMFRQMLEALSYLQGLRILHRDVKTENFLLGGEVGSPSLLVKLCDFGTSVELTTSIPRCSSQMGTLSYTAPEVYEQKGAGFPSDAWSLGVVLYVMLTGVNPWQDGKSQGGSKTSQQDMLSRIRRANFNRTRSSWLRLSASCQTLVGQLLVVDEQQRLTPLLALSAQWVSEDTRRPDSLGGMLKNAAIAAFTPEALRVLMRYGNLDLAQRLALAACASVSELRNEASALWRGLFLCLDRDRDGRLLVTEMCRGFEACQTTHAALEDCATAMDLDSNGYIDWVEWRAAALLCDRSLLEDHDTSEAALRFLMRLSSNEGGAQHANAAAVVADWEEAQHAHSQDHATSEPGHVLSLKAFRNVIASCKAEPESLIDPAACKCNIEW